MFHYFNQQLRKGILFFSGLSVLFLLLLFIASITGRFLSITLLSFFPVLGAIFALMAGLELVGLIKLSLPFSLSMQNRHPFAMGIIFGIAALGCVTPLTASLLMMLIAGNITERIVMILLFNIGFFIPIAIGSILLRKFSITVLAAYVKKIRKGIGVVLICSSIYLLYILI